MSADNYRICPKCKKEENSLREDYEIYSDGNSVYISYSCYCEICNFEFRIDKNYDMF